MSLLQPLLSLLTLRLINNDDIHTMLIRHISLLSCLMLCLPGAGFAACSKADIEFYLDKGFNQEQITQLCGISETSVPDYKPYQQQVIIYSDQEAPGIKDGFTREERKAIKDLQLGADVKGLTVDQESIRYTVQVCLAVQEGKDYNQRFKTCPEVFYVVSRSGLTVSASGKKYGFFGQPAVQIVGEIKRTPKQNFDDYPARFKKQLKRHFDWKTGGNKTNVPIRGNFSVTKLYNALVALTKEADPNATIAQHEANDDVESVEEYDSNPKKKKRWWNPFD